jgi:hypothetical protein
MDDSDEGPNNAQQHGRGRLPLFAVVFFPYAVLVSWIMMRRKIKACRSINTSQI